MPCRTYTCNVEAGYLSRIKTSPGWSAGSAVFANSQTVFAIHVPATVRKRQSYQNEVGLDALRVRDRIVEIDYPHTIDTRMIAPHYGHETLQPSPVVIWSQRFVQKDV